MPTIPDLSRSAETEIDYPPAASVVRTRRQKDGRVAYTLALKWAFGGEDDPVPDLPEGLVGPCAGWVSPALRGNARAFSMTLHGLAEGVASLWSVVVPEVGAAAETEQHVVDMDAVIERFHLRAAKGAGQVVVHVRLIGNTLQAPGIVGLDRGACILDFRQTSGTQEELDLAAQRDAGDVRRAKARAAKAARAERAAAERRRQATASTELVP